MHTRHLLPVILQRKVKCEAADTLGLGPGGYLQALNNPRVALVFKTGVFAFCVLANNGKIDIGMPGRNSGKGLAKNNRRIDVELLAYSDIP